MRNLPGKLSLAIGVLVFIVVGWLFWRSASETGWVMSVAPRLTGKNNLDLPKKQSKSPLAAVQENDAAKSFLPFYFYRTNSDKQTVEFFRIADSIGSADQKVFELKGDFDVINGSGKDGHVLLRKDEANALYDFDVPNQSASQVATAEAGRSIGDALFMDDGSLLAYLTFDKQKSEDAASAVDTRIHLLELETKKEKGFLISEKSPIYSGFSILYKEGSSFYLVERGGDGGGSFEVIHRLDLESGEIVKIAENSHDMGSLESGEETGPVNQLGTRRVFVRQASYQDADIENESGSFPGCLKDYKKYAEGGDALVVEELATGRRRELFRNNEHNDNYCKNLIQYIHGLMWRDNERVAFETVSGIYELNTAIGKIKTIYEFPWFSDPQTVNRPTMVYADEKYIVFDDGSILDLTTRKIMALQSAYESPKSSPADFHFLDFSAGMRRIR